MYGQPTFAKSRGDVAKEHDTSAADRIITYNTVSNAFNMGIKEQHADVPLLTRPKEMAEFCGY